MTFARPLLISLGLLFVLLSTSLSCGPDFDPYWKVDRLRILGIQADPVIARPMEPTTLRAEVWAPDDPIDYQWSWCPLRLSAQDEYRCPIDADDFAQWIDEDDFDDDPFDLGDESEATFTNPFEPDEVQAFCEAIQAAILDAAGDQALAEFLPGGDCSDGYEVSIRLAVSTDSKELVAAKRFRLWAGGDEPNENPSIEGIQFRPDDPDDAQRLAEDFDWPIDPDAPHDEHWVDSDLDTPLSVPPDLALEWRTLIDPDSVLTYTPPTPRGSDEPPEPRQESYVYRHFTTLGDIGSSRHLFSPQQNTLEEASKTDFDVDPDSLDDCLEPIDGGCSIKLWTVVRDSRLGQSWAATSLELREDS